MNIVTPQPPALQALLDNLTQGVVVIARNGRVESANRAAATLLSLPPERLLGMSLRTVISPLLANAGGSEATPCPIVATLTDGQRRQFSDQLNVADGRCARIHVVIAAVRDGEAITGAMLIVTNLDEHQHSHTALAHLNEQLIALLEALPDPVFFKDGHGRWQIANRPAIKLFRLDGIDWVGKTDRELAELNPELRPEHLACIDNDEAAWQAGTLCSFMETVCNADGEQQFEVRKLPLFDGVQRRALVVIGRDVSQRMAMERELRIAAAAFATHDAILVLDAQLRIVRVNAAFTAQTGYDASAVVGGGTEFLRSGLHSWDHRSRVIDRMRRQGYSREDTWVRRQNGEVYPARVFVSCVAPEHVGDERYYVAVISDLSDQRKAEHALQQLAVNDQLTGLPNREHFFTALDSRVQVAAQGPRWSALLLLDMDRFKLLNEAFGHQAGDALLRQCRDRIRGCLPAHSLLSRLGGDEFAIVLDALGDCRESAGIAAQAIASNVRRAITAPFVLAASTHPYESTASIGIQLFDGTQGNAQHLLKQAELALYRAKAEGRDCERLFDPQMQEVATSGIAMEAALRNALRKGELCYYYQPIVDGDGAVCAHEALLRWNSVVFGLLTPDAFMPRLRDAGLLPEVTAWGLDAVCAHIAQHHCVGKSRTGQIALNVDASMFRQADFVDVVRSAIARHGIDGQLLKMELTEHVLLDDVTASAGKMQQLGALGVSFSLDDFGTGYSSLRYLKLLPISQIKIDQSFVSDMLADPQSDTIIDALLAMAAALGLEVVAEGVETREQFMHLSSKGCRLFQGYWFGRPQAIVAAVGD